MNTGAPSRKFFCASAFCNSGVTRAIAVFERGLSTGAAAPAWREAALMMGLPGGAAAVAAGTLASHPAAQADTQKTLPSLFKSSIEFVFMFGENSQIPPDTIAPCPFEETSDEYGQQDKRSRTAIDYTP
jgi:hypothetical protein